MTLLEFYEKRRPRAYETSWHHKWTCEVLERAHRERKNAIIEEPPRHGKSEIANVYAPAWRLDERYDSMFGLVCNGDSLAKKFSAATRALVSLPLEVDRDAQWKVRGLQSLNYTYLAAGIRGQLTGHGFDTLLLDDLLKSGQEAKSEAVRETVWENMASAAINRLTPDGIVVAMQARLHHEDTIGKLLGLGHLKFLRLRLPATNDSGADAWFRDGYDPANDVVFPAYSALWPTRYSREKLDEIKATVNPYYWSAQYQQAPSMGDLGYFDVERMPEHDGRHGCECSWIAVDAANTQTKSGSFTAFVCMGFDGSSLRVLGARRGRWRQDAIHQQLRDFYAEMSRFTGTWPERVIVERAAAGYGIIDGLSWALPIEPIVPLGSKEDRAGAVCYLVNRGQVSLPKTAPWLAEFKSELQNFPLCAANDQVDAFVHCLSYAARPSEFKPRERRYVVERDAVEELRLSGGGLPDLDEEMGLR